MFRQLSLFFILLMWVACAVAFGQELTAFNKGFLDRTGYVPIDHFKKVPNSILAASDKYAKQPSDRNYDSLLSALAANPRSLGGVKILFENSYKSKRIHQAIAYFNDKGYIARSGTDQWRYQLDYAYLLRLCERNQIKTKALIQLSDKMVSSLASKAAAEDYEAMFVIAEIGADVNTAESRRILEKLLAMKPNDYRVHTVLGISYLYGLGPIYRMQNGKPVVVAPSPAPVRGDLALAHAKAAISLNNRYAPAFYLAYRAETDRAKKDEYLRSYVEYEQDHSSAIYVKALKSLP